jgi:hypothetical protein
MSVRVQDFALIIGHVWRCHTCRDELYDKPDTIWMGYKLSDDQKARIRTLTDDCFASIPKLAEVTGLDSKEIEAAIEHPRARLRHLGSIKGDYFQRQNGSD